jgi:protein tyrosine/serine phosphatase
MKCRDDLVRTVVLAVALSVLAISRHRCGAQDTPMTTAKRASTAIWGEKVPSDDAAIKDLHSLGLINGRTNIFRSASPVRDLVDNSGEMVPNATEEAQARLRRLYDLGIRTIISFETPDEPEPKSAATDEGKAKRIRTCVTLEKAAAADAGIKYISHPIANSGKNSLEDMSDNAVCKLLDSIGDQVFQEASHGGVLYHCSAGHDRTGIVTAYMRMKYQHWPVDQAIDEMRRYGHNWPKFSHDGGNSSWHEDHLRAIDKQMANATP